MISKVNRDSLPAKTRLRVSEIFYSLQGEADTMGLPTVFVRLTGCPLRCVYCDTAYAFYGGDWMSIDDVIRKVAEYEVKAVCVTGGEPLAQKNAFDLLRKLCDGGWRVSLETSGAIDIAMVDKRVIKILDIKTPGSAEVGRNLWANLDHLSPDDQIKFVICDRTDYLWVRDQLAQKKLPEICTNWLSPSHGQLEPVELAQWILADRLQVRMQLQLHKYIWGEEPGH